MNKTLTCLLVAAAALLAIGCAPTAENSAKPAKPTKTTKPIVGQIVLEVENFTLKDAKVRALSGAGGGKAVLFHLETASAKTTVNLKKGNYEITVYALAPDAGQDAFYLTAAGADERIYPQEEAKLSPTRAVKITVSKDGPVKIEISAAEKGMSIDRLVIKPAK